MDFNIPELLQQNYQDGGSIYKVLKCHEVAYLKKHGTKDQHDQLPHVSESRPAVMLLPVTDLRYNGCSTSHDIQKIAPLAAVPLTTGSSMERCHWLQREMFILVSHCPMGERKPNPQIFQGLMSQLMPKHMVSSQSTNFHGYCAFSCFSYLQKT